MSGIPPHLDVEPGTPVGEWAVKTTSALQSETAETANASSMNPTTAQLLEEKSTHPGTTAETSTTSNDSTPGSEFPGAFPNKQSKPVGSEITDTVTQTANKVAQAVTQTAQVYVPAAAEKIGQYMPKSVADKMSEYIPGMSNPQGTVRASEHDILHIKSMPSTELTGAHAGEHVGGVGSLPGSLGERSVTKLPDERMETATPATVAGAAVAATETAKGTAEEAQSTAHDTMDRIMHGGHSTAVTASTVPSRELEGAKPGDHSSGVGALPGSLNEPGVAILPDERRHSGHGAHPGHKGKHGAAVHPNEHLAGEIGPSLAAQGTPSKTGETTHLAEPARQEGIASHQPRQSETKEEKKEEEKAGAAAVGAAVGEKAVKDEHAKDQEKETGAGPLNKHQHEEMQADLRHVNLTPRIHALGLKGEHWAGKDPGSERYRRGEDIDLAEGDMYQTDYHPAALHPLDADYSKEPKVERDRRRDPAGEKEQEKPLTGASHADSKMASHAGGTSTATEETEKAKKVGFMTKMKGEAKILLGKVEGKKGHEKVLEGQRIKAGETTTAQ
ncbi:hypothetical protein BDY19DRAFT_928909 [Irpex rosettiformis]|uniref:Uncharacterized protein n=1 Tax=Irpex rosettiformis TaxID=378272 RepID=A0ACB8UD98_9APHY|nr:hypothetical protein BDY19DRAFT_928909 [Irpex rosettiformis]